MKTTTCMYKPAMHVGWRSCCKGHCSKSHVPNVWQAQLGPDAYICSPAIHIENNCFISLCSLLCRKYTTDCMEDNQLLKALWTFVMKLFGLLSVMYIGVQMILKWFVDSLGSIPVSYLLIMLSYITVYNSYYGEGISNEIWIDVAGGCVGTEKSLLSCTPSPFVTPSCSLDQLAGVQCSVPCKFHASRLLISC